MRTYIKNKSQLFIIFLIVGFFSGVICGNVVFKDSFYSSMLFQENALKQLVNVEIISEKYILYILKERIVILILFFLLGAVRWKKLMAGMSLLVIGFMNGILMTAAVAQLGVSGILIYIIGMMPQYIFYFAGIGFILMHWVEEPKRKWNGIKVVFVVIMFAVGIITETYVNPWLIKSIMNII